MFSSSWLRHDLDCPAPVIIEVLRLRLNLRVPEHGAAREVRRGNRRARYDAGVEPYHRTGATGLYPGIERDRVESWLVGCPHSLRVAPAVPEEHHIGIVKRAADR